jgi:hypothetical protein
MRDDTWNALASALAVLPMAVDRIVKETGPAANAIGGEVQLFYFGLVILSVQLWRIAVAVPGALGVGARK